MEILKSIIYGIIAGIAEFLPISSAAHQLLLETIFDMGQSEPIRNLFIHLAILIAVYAETARGRKKLQMSRQGQRRRNKNQTSQTKSLAEYRFLWNIAIPFIVTQLLLYYIFSIEISLLVISVSLCINGLIIFLPERMLQGNKNATVMSTLDGVLIGSLGALSVFPGVSRVGCMISGATLCGAERKSAVNWSLMLSIPALFFVVIMDVFSIFSGASIEFWGNLLFNIFAAISAYAGTRLSIYILRRYIRSRGCTGYAYYCWGVALLTLILFLMIG